MTNSTHTPQSKFYQQPQPTRPAAVPTAFERGNLPQFGNGGARRLGGATDPDQTMRIEYNANLLHHEDDAGLWNHAARGYANVWLEHNSCIFPPAKGEIIMGVEKLNHPHTQTGFLEYMGDIKREWEATKELAREINAKPARLIPDEKPVKFVPSASPFGPKPFDPELQQRLEKDKMETMERIAERERARQAALQPTASPDLTQSPDTDDAPNLNNIFPRTPDGQPMPDKALINGQHWQKDDKARTDFFKAYSSLCNKHQVPHADHKREKLRAAAQGTEHLEQYPGTPDELLAACKVFIEAEYPLEMAQDEPTKKPSESLRFDSPATPTPKTPATPADDAPASVAMPNEIDVLQRTISALQNKILELEQKDSNPKMTNELPEAPFSANFHLRNKRGVRIQYTIRASNVQDGTDRVDALIDILLEKRGFATDESIPTRTSGNGTSAPASDESGASLCALIKVGKSYTGNKSQLQFECDGFDQPLRYTRDNLVQILANAKQTNGNAFTSNDLTDGRKFGGEWMVEWKKESGSDGKNHINVIAVRNAA